MGRCSQGLTQSATVDFAWKDREKTRRIYVSLIYVPNEIEDWHIQNMGPKHYCLSA